MAGGSGIGAERSVLSKAAAAADLGPRVCGVEGRKKEVMATEWASHRRNMVRGG